ncbi:helix-turn-helix domain-containing protein [Pallidibacillus thermolactis]|uniref:helix-turn-helix domain-containing protein n=1 Tax=Pallidibacillus thermolactis TaxID=251051 RepID=UPI002E1E5643|nr:helix-turn-helix domain-containing protein [Pallidibacillus thermolactis subsp. kokeshiiformis]
MPRQSKTHSNHALLVRHRGYELKENGIYPVSDEVEYYDPFSKMETGVLKEILGKDYVEVDFDVHTLFLNLNAKDPKQIYRFVQNYGLLYNPLFMDEELQKDLIHQYSLKQLRYRIGIFSNFYSEEDLFLISSIVNRGIYLKEFQQEIARLRMVVELYRVIKEHDISILTENTRFMLFYEYNLSHPTLQPFKDLLQHPKLKKKLASILSQIETLHTNKKNFSRQQFELLNKDIDEFFSSIIDLKLEETVIEMCIVYLEAIMETGLKGTSPNITFDIDGIGDQTWTFSGLLAAIYFRIQQDFVAGKRYKHCKNPNCHHIFIAKAKNNNYCSPQCQTRAKTARERARKKAKAIHLYEQGRSIEEIARELKIEPERVRSWINKYEADR